LPKPNANKNPDSSFESWLKHKLWPDAQARGISPQTFAAATRGLQPDWSLPDLIKPGQTEPDTKGQTEFGNPSAYFKPANINFLLGKVKPLEQRWDKTLSQIEQRYGVPRHIILAIWGRESAFGLAKLPHDAIRALATLGYAGARKDEFYPELLAALQILQQGHIDRDGLKSSWAGALGHPQFMPSKFLEFAVDFDGDGKRDIWNSVPDNLASIANFLKQHGWNRQRGWGQEAQIPASVSCSLEGPDQGQPGSAWRKLGIQTKQPKDQGTGQLFLLMPAGRYGPGFLVSENFYVLKDYNESDLYALFIGHLADRMQGGKPFEQAWQDVLGLKRSDVRRMQERLIQLGHDVGGADGLVGFKTRRSIGRWQQSQGLKPSCWPDRELIKQLQ
jgi:lytic murein transglycosylase